MGAWLTSDDSSGRDLRERPAKAFAADTLRRRRKTVRKAGRHLARLPADARHQVRIEVKKLRYAAEFFAGLFEKGKRAARRKPFLAALEDLQQSLGDLNDAAVAEEMLGALSQEEGPEREARRRACALIAEHQRSRASDLLRPAAAAFRSFDDAKRFWS